METSLIVRSCKFLVRCAFFSRRRSIAWLLLLAAGLGAIFLLNLAVDGRPGSDRLIRNDGEQSRPGEGAEIIQSNRERKFISDDVTQTGDDVRTYKTSTKASQSRANMADDHRDSVVGVDDEADNHAGLDEPVDPDERRFHEKLKVVERCGKPSRSSEPPPMDLNDTFRWQKMDPGFGLSYVTSAFYDPRWDPPTILIIGISDSQNFVILPHYCRVWYPGQTQPEVVRGERNLNFDSHGKRFHEAYHQCQLPRNRSSPYAVSLISDKCGVADNLLKVIYYPSGYQPEVNFTVCVSPVNRRYDNYHQLVENIEVNRMFGAQRFIIYNYSTGSNFAHYLASYVDDGIVEVQPWQVPVVVVEETVPAGQTNTEIHYYGQVGALNDCLYRNMYRSRFIVYTDLDEMIVPRKHRNWLDMLGSLSEDPENVASYIFKNTFFRSDWNVDRLGGNNSLAVSLQLKTLLVTEREQAIWPWFQRSKIIVNPRKVGWVGVHMIMTSIPGSHLESLNVRSDDALLHHYRLEWNEPQIRVLDRSMHRFTADIIARVSRRYEIVRSRRKTK